MKCFCPELVSYSTDVSLFVCSVLETKRSSKEILHSLFL